MKFVLFALLVAASSGAAASPYFVGNPYSPVPPGCALNTHGAPLWYAIANGNSVRVWEGQVTLPRVDDPRILWHFPSWSNGVTVRLEVYRVACAEPGQSALVASFTRAGEFAQHALPRFYRDYNGFGGPEFSVTPQFGGGSYMADPGRDGTVAFGDFVSSYDGIGWFSWQYVLDVAMPTYEADGWPVIDVDDYNGDFAIGLWTGYSNHYIPVPATTDVLVRNDSQPLNGRLSGMWVVEGTRDQGLLLWVSSRVPPAHVPAADAESSPLLFALTWFTFDAAGDPLWLTGAAEFPQGWTQVDIPIDHTQHGAFLGATPAERSVAGSVRLIGKSCDNLEMQWDLTPMGLGTGTRRLQRFEALEVAGYACRDYESRQRSLAVDAAP